MEIFKIDPSVLTVLVLLTCLACIWMVFFFGRRLQTTAYLRDSLIEGARQQELKILLRELHDKAMEGPLDPRQPPPDGYGRTDRLWEPWKQEAANLDSVSCFYDETEDQKAKRLEREQKENQFKAEVKKWELEERVRYDALRQLNEKSALERARKKIPSSIDISLLGGGWAFLLEFSTVIVIIFTLLILGILGTLEGKDISTILAAIAGYVLGKASSGTKAAEKEIGDSSSTLTPK